MYAIYKQGGFYLILDDIIQKKEISILNKKKKISTFELKEKAKEIVKIENERFNNNYANPFKAALQKDRLSVIGEFKKASPSKGVIVNEFNIYEILNYYNHIGVDAFSILTEENFFKGKDEYIRRINSISETPILRKDFVIDFYQIYEAKVLGASGILLIVSVLGENLKEYYEEAKKFNLEPLVEVHNKEELNIALKYDCNVIGINNRNLKNFEVSLETSKKLIKEIPENKIKIIESGIMSIEDLKKAQKYGADGVLIGELFMKNIRNYEFYEKYKKFKK